MWRKFCPIIILKILCIFGLEKGGLGAELPDKLGFLNFTWLSIYTKGIGIAWVLIHKKSCGILWPPSIHIAIMQL
jgi:hypothetical protein